MSNALRACVRNTLSLAGVVLLVGSMALSACAIPVLLVALFWLG